MLIAIAALVAAGMMLALPRSPQERERVGRMGRAEPDGQPSRFERKRPVVSSPNDAAAILLPRMQHLKQEHLVVMVLDIRHRLIAEPLEVNRGLLNSTTALVGELMRQAIRVNGTSIILAHNHPDGDPAPTQEDAAITRAVMKAGRLVDIALLDHLVIGSGTYVSMKSRGLGF